MKTALVPFIFCMFITLSFAGAVVPQDESKDTKLIKAMLDKLPLKDLGEDAPDITEPLSILKNLGTIDKDKETALIGIFLDSRPENLRHKMEAAVILSAVHSELGVSLVKLFIEQVFAIQTATYRDKAYDWTDLWQMFLLEDLTGSTDYGLLWCYIGDILMLLKDLNLCKKWVECTPLDNMSVENLMLEARTGEFVPVVVDAIKGKGPHCLPLAYWILQKGKTLNAEQKSQVLDAVKLLVGSAGISERAKKELEGLMSQFGVESAPIGPPPSVTFS